MGLEERASPCVRCTWALRFWDRTIVSLGYVTSRYAMNVGNWHYSEENRGRDDVCFAADSVEKLRKAISLAISDRPTDSRRIDDSTCLP